MNAQACGEATRRIGKVWGLPRPLERYDDTKDILLMQSSESVSGLLVANRWLIVLFTVLMVVTAALAGNGIFRAGTDPWLITGHMHLGNTMVFLSIAQGLISYVLFSQKQISVSVLMVSILVFVLTFIQIGLGYMTRSRMVDIVGWHIALGVALTATVAILASLLWLKPQPTRG